MPVSRPTNSSSDGPPVYWKSDCGRAVVYVGDCRNLMEGMAPEQFPAVVTDPPYEFISGAYHVRAAKAGGGVPMTGNWDCTGVAFDPRTWLGALRVCRPGAHLLSFGGTRVFHRMVCAIEDAGFEVRDMLMWLYSSGYPKGLDVSKGIDKELGATSLRRVVGREVLPDTTKVRAGFTGRAHSGDGAGAVREVEITEPATDLAKQWEGWNTTLRPAWEPVVMSRKPLRGGVVRNVVDHGCGGINVGACRIDGEDGDRWPTNVLHDGEDADLRRWFYSAKANADADRNRPHGDGAVAHPTVKPLELMRYLVRLVCPRGGTVLDLFGGTMSTGCAAIEEGMRFVGIEQSREYADLGVGRLKLALERSPVTGVLDSPGGRPCPRTQDAAPSPRRLR